METFIKILLFLCLLTGRALGQSTHLGCYTEDVINPAFANVIYVNNETTASECCDMCLQTTNSRCGLSETIACQCSNTIVAAALPQCGDVCLADGSYCGLLADAKKLDVYDTGGGPPDFTLTLVESAPSVTVTVDYITSSEQFYLDFGDQTPLVIGSETLVIISPGNYQKNFQYQLTMIPGNYTLTVTGTIPKTSLIYSERYVLTIIDAIPSIDIVECPELREPDISYLCNVSVTYKNAAHTYTAIFDDNNLPITLQNIGSVIKQIGISVPKDNTTESAPTTSSPTSVIRLFQHTIMKASLLLALEYWPGDENPLSFSLLVPTCLVDTSYCVNLQACLATCPYDLITATYNCDVFYPLEEMCVNAAATGGTAPIWTTTTIYSDTGGPVTVNEQYRFVAPIPLLPGTVLQVTGSLQRSYTQAAPGDTVDGIATEWHHYVSMIVKELVTLPLFHTCTVVMQNVTLTITDDADPANTWAGIPASTMCERNITDLALDINQTDTDAYNSTLNLENPFYVRTLIPFDIIAIFSVAGPIRFDLNFTPPNTPEITVEYLVDYPFPNGPYSLPISRIIVLDGIYELVVDAYNSHNILPNETTGIVLGPITAQITIYALHMVTQTWFLAPVGDITVPAAFLVPRDMPTIIFEDPSGAPFPTNATVSIDWGDGTPFEVLPFLNPGSAKPIFTHLYIDGDVYSISANITNLVSGLFYIPLTITIYEQIFEYFVAPMYFSRPTSIESRPGFGRTMNQYPVDKNVSFFPTMSQGTVETYTLLFTNNGTIIQEYTVADKFLPTADFYNYHFYFETFLNITLIAKNAFEAKPFDMFIEIVSQLRGLQINDYDVTAANELKTFLITCESVGGGSCIAVAFGDGSNYLTFGEEATCKLNFSHAVYDPTIEIDIEVNVTHIYMENGMYNITALGYNEVSQSSDMMMFPVTDLKCAPPKLTFPGQNLDYLSSPILFRGEENSFLVIGKIKCEITPKTKKRWQIYGINEETGMMEPAIPIMDIIPTWNKSELVIPKSFLNYGYFKLVYTLTMWDPDIPVLKQWTFQRQADHYILIIKTSLNPALTATYMSRLARGLDQFLLLEPAVHTIDLDFPDVKNYTVKWKCKRLGETYPDPLPVVDVAPVNLGGAGCFGYGPGILKLTTREFNMQGKAFAAVGETYQIEAIVMKDTRTGSAKIDVAIEAMSVPTLELRCSTDSLCRPSEDGKGVYVNANLRMGLIVECILACDETLTYEWKVFDKNDVLLALSNAAIPLGKNEKEFVLSTQFFDEHPTLTDFCIQIEVTNMANPPALGFSAYYMKVNKPPQNGNCVINAYEGFTLIDTFTLTCKNWKDPEKKGVEFYTVRLLNPPEAPMTMSETRHTSDPQILIYLLFPVGEFTLEITITDVWGATTVITLPQTIKIVMITEEQFNSLDVVSLLDKLSGEGNAAMVSMVALAADSVMNEAEWLNIDNVDCTMYENCNAEIERRMLVINTVNSKAVQAIMDNSNFLTLGSAEAASGALAAIMESASRTPNHALTIDILTRGDIFDLLDTMAEKIGAMPIGSPEELRKMVENIGTIAAGLVVGIEEVTGDENATRIPPMDFLNADDMAYDTDIGYDIEMTIPESVDSAKKYNIRDTTELNSKLQMPRLDGIMNKLDRYVLSKQVLGESLDVDTKNNMTINNGIFKQLSDERHYAGKSWAEFPVGLCPQGNCSKSVGLSMREWPTLTFPTTKSAKMLNGGSHVLDVSVYDRKSNPLTVNYTENPIFLSLYRTFYKRGNLTGPVAEFVNASYESVYQSIPIMYTKFEVSKDGAGVNIELTPIGPVDRMFLMIMKPRLPTLQNYTQYKLLRDIPINVEGMMDYFLSSKDLSGTGTYYLGIGQFKSNVLPNQRLRPIAFNATIDWLENVTTNYHIRVYSTGCYFYSLAAKKWGATGIVVTGSDYDDARCETNHLTSFGSGMFVMPNTIDFSYVFAHMGFADNLTIYLTLILSAVTFIGLLIWARWKDRKDFQSLGAAPLIDNQLEDKYLYEILVFTGNKKEAQTDSTVQFVVSGEYEDSDVRTLADDRRKILRKASVDVFVMAVPRPLGPLNYLRIWHDNSGKGPNASWFLSYIVFRDVQTGEKFEFISNEWFAVESKDGQIERVIGVAGKEDKGQFGHLFHNISNKNLSDGHLWFSVFMRPPRSRFTRCQRVGSCAALLFLSMLVNAMWYDTVPSQPTSGGLNIGPFSLSPEQIGVGVMSNLIVFPPSFLIVLFFRKARPRVLRKSRIEEALKRASDKTKESKMKNDDQQQFSQQGNDQGDENGGFNEGHNNGGSSQNNDKEKYQRNPSIEKQKKKTKKKKFTLPWWFLHVAWLLVVVCIAASLFFLLMYGIMFGNEKATKWVTALIISFFSSVLFVQPIKVFLTAMFMSILCKSVDLDEDDADEDEEKAHLNKDELWLYEGARSKKLGYSKMDKALLDELRRRRLNEIEMWKILMELCGYMVFIWILLILSYGQRDPMAFYMQKNFRNTFIRKGLSDGTDYSAVTDSDMYWFYLHNALLGQLRADVMYNGKAPYHLRGFLNDYANRIMGYGTIRQIRAKPNSCRIPNAMKNVTKGCAGVTTLISEEKRDFCKGWKLPNENTVNTSNCQIPEYKYETDKQLQNLPYWGKGNRFGGGGYTIHLRGPTSNLLEKFQFLQENFWIDYLTRAILIEFSTYNTQVNLFGICTIIAEFIPGGGIRPYYRFDAIRLLQHHDNFGGFIIACEIIFVLFTIYFTFRELKLLWKQKLRYFDSYWAYAELSIIGVSYSAIAVYFVRAYETDKALKVFDQTYGNGYVKMTYAALMDEIYGYFISFLVFVGSIKFIKLLRFNKRMGVLSATLHQCWDDLSGFMIAFCICFLAFVLMFYLFLNQLIEDFSSFSRSFETSFSMMMGKFEFAQMQQAHPLVPVMFFSFVLCTSWVLINLLMTLIIKSFEQVKDDLKKQPNEYEMVDFVFGRFKSFLGMTTMSSQTSAQPPVIQTTEPPEDPPNRVDDLPGKVDKFLDYINKVYFGGSMDLKNKNMMKDSLMLPPRPIIGADLDQGIDYVGYYKNPDMNASPRHHKHP